MVEPSRRAAVIAAALLSAAVAYCALALWNAADLSVPLAWDKGGDAMFNLLLAATVEEHGWHFFHSRLGAPTGMELYSWAGSGFLSIAAFRMLAVVFDGAGAIVNAFYLIGWPAAGATAAWAFMRFRVTPTLAMVLGVLFAALPGHLLRGEPHLLLANFAVVPLALVAARQIAVEGFSNRGRWYLVAAAFVVTGFEPYYGFFGVLFVSIGTLIGWSQHGRRRLVDGALFGFGAVLGLLPTIAPRLLHAGAAISERPASDTEILGLKLAQLLLPVVGHRSELLRRITRKYLDTGAAPSLINENIASALGLIGAVGLLLLLVHVIVTRLPSQDPSGLDATARLALGGILFATVGGLNVLFATFIHPQVRGYNRISVFVGFLALATAGLVLDSLLRRLRSPSQRAGLTFALAVGMLGFGAWDQSSHAAIPRHQDNLREWAIDQEWVARAEVILPPGAMVFQLPYVAFPESVPVNRMFNWDSLRPILHSSTLRWSYGAVKHSETDLWQRATSALPTRDLLGEIAQRGFAALVIDRWAYPDDGAAFAAELEGHLGAPLLGSSNGRWAVYSLGPISPVPTQTGGSP